MELCKYSGIKRFMLNFQKGCSIGKRWCIGLPFPVLCINLISICKWGCCASKCCIFAYQWSLVSLSVCVFNCLVDAQRKKLNPKLNQTWQHSYMVLCFYFSWLVGLGFFFFIGLKILHPTVVILCATTCQMLIPRDSTLQNCKTH